MSTDHAKVHETARGRLYRLLSDLKWHSHRELSRDGSGRNRFSSRMGELERKGYKIERRPVREGVGKEYRLVSLEPGTPRPKKVKVYVEESDVQEMVLGRIPQRASAALLSALDIFRANKHKL